MKIHELLVENEQIDEGPLSAIGTGLGKVAGGAAKAVGAVAGGVAGLGSAFKKGYQSGKKTVAGDEEPAADASAEPAAAEEPASGGAPAAAAPAEKPKSAFGRLNTAANSGTKAEPGAAPAAAGAASSPAMGAMAKQLGGEKPNTMANAPVSKTNTAKPGNPNAAAPAEPAAASTAKPAAAPAAAADPKADTAYAQAQKAVQGLAPEQKSEIVAMLKADPKVGAAMKQKAPTAAPAKAGSFNNQLAGGKQTVSTGAKFDPATMKNTSGTPVGDKVQGGVPNATNPTTTAPAAAPASAPAAAPASAPAAAPASKAPEADATDAGKPGFLQTKLKGRRPGASQAEIDADRERMMGKFTDSVERYKKQMTESAIRKGEISIFRNR